MCILKGGELSSIVLAMSKGQVIGQSGSAERKILALNAAKCIKKIKMVRAIRNLACQQVKNSFETEKSFLKNDLILKLILATRKT